MDGCTLLINIDLTVFNCVKVFVLKFYLEIKIRDLMLLVISFGLIA